MSNDSELGAGKTCFIVSPIGSKLDPVGSPGRSRYEESIVMWEEVFEAATLAFGLAPVRADRISETGEIPDQIFTYLRDADVVIADLSHANPNVMYELGLRHSRPGKITIQIGEQSMLPFDLITIRTIKFNRTPAGLIGVRNDLTEALRTALNGGGTPLRATTIFSDAAAAAVNLALDVERSTAPAEDLVALDEPGTLEMLAEGEASIGHVSEVLSEAGTVIQRIGVLMKEATDRSTESDRSGKGFAGRLLVARQLSDDLKEPTETLADYGNEYYDDVVRMDAMIRFIVDRVESGEEDGPELRSFFGSVVGLIDAADESAVFTMGFRDSSAGLAKSSKLLAPISRQLVTGLDRFLEAIGMISAWRPELEPLLVEEKDEDGGAAQSG